MPWFSFGRFHGLDTEAGSRVCLEEEMVISWRRAGGRGYSAAGQATTISAIPMMVAMLARYSLLRWVSPWTAIPIANANTISI